jgi:hypothetical protein
MEHAPLRPVPARPAGPIDPAMAVREMDARVPTLPPIAARALALVVLAERPRAEVTEAVGVSEPELGELLASARKELRQTIVVLGGSGWCERAEGLISDRLDGALGERDARRLDVHLRNCSRCVEHERRLVQATDALVGGVGGGAARGRAPASEAPPLVEAPAPGGGEELAPPGPAAEPPQHASAQTAGGPADPASADPAAAPSPSGDEIEAAAELLVGRRTRGQIAAAVAWNSLIAVAILLALATIALTIAGILGAKL